MLTLYLFKSRTARSLDVSLQTHNGPVRTFLILARFASRAVLDEELDRWRNGSNDDSIVDRTYVVTTDRNLSSDTNETSDSQTKSKEPNPLSRAITKSFSFRGFGPVFSAWLNHVRVVALLNTYEFWLTLRMMWRGVFG